MGNPMFECANEIERFNHPNRLELLKESNDKWLSHRLSEKEWSEQVINHLKQLLPDRWIMVSLYCLSHQPVLIPWNSSPGFRIACYLPEGCYLWPLSHMPVHIIQSSTDKEECGYHEERIVCHFLCRLEDENKNHLLNDIEFVYDTCIHNGYLPTTIDYLYKSLYMGTRMPTIMNQYMNLPLHPEIRKSICHFGRYIITMSKLNALRASKFIDDFLSVTLLLSDEEEWNTVVQCREACGLSIWDKKKVNSVIPVKYGNNQWLSRWRTVDIRYQKKTYNERCDERIQWVSVWLRLIMANKMKLKDSPAHLISLLCLLGTSKIFD